MLHRRRRFAVGLASLAVTSVGWFVVGPATAESRSDVVVGASQAPATIAATVQANGTGVGPTLEWRVHKPGAGEYVLEFERDVRVDVPSWDAAATMTLRPSSARTWVVAFVQGDDPVNSAFSFSAVPASP